MENKNKKSASALENSPSAVNKKSSVLWGGRFGSRPEAEAFAFQASIKIDKRLVFDDIAGTKAHVLMLSKQNIIPKDEAVKLDKELNAIAHEILTGKLEVDTESYEDIHSFIEGVLTQRLGDAGKMIHAGRSRNDQAAVDFRLYLTRSIPKLQKELAHTIEVIADAAEQHTASIMPGYTHLQRAQPITLGFHLTAWGCALIRDLCRLEDVLYKIDECPLGSGALAGATLPLDRKETAKALGFSRPTLNAMDSIADRDFALELSSACAITMVHLSRFCEDIILWASEEFKFIELSEHWSTGSSIMPQKKNPDFAELIRGKSGRAIGNVVTLFTLLKGLPYAYNKDLQEDKEAVFDSIDTLFTCLRMFAGMIKSAEFNLGRMKSACKGGFLEATDTAEYLVNKGLPFRTAHEAAALIVRDCIEAGQRHIADRTLDELKKRSNLFEDDIYKLITPYACVKGRKLAGGCSQKEVKRQIKSIRKKIEYFLAVNSEQ